MFGKPVRQYLAFQKAFLIALAAVGLARLGLSLAGLPNATVLWFSMNVVVWAGTLYYGVAVHTNGFGGYRQLLPLVLFQMLLFQGIAVLGILLAIAGRPNIFAAPEYSFGTQSQWVHALAHLTVGIVVPVLLTWGIASLVMLVARKVAPRRVPAAA
jgi:hypothetical protein